MNNSTRQLMGFLSIGIAVNLGAVIAFYMMTQMLGLNMYFSLYFLFLIAIFVSYQLNAKYSFRSDNRTKKSLFKFGLINVLALSIQTIMVTVAATYSIHTTIGYFAALVFSAGINFILIKKYVF